MADLKRALEGHQNKSGRHDNPLRRPLSSRERDVTSHSSGSESMVSYSDHGDSAIGVAPPLPEEGAELNGNGNSEPQPTRDTQQKQQLGTVHDATTLPSISESRPGSSMQLPGTWPREASPARKTSRKSQAQDQQATESSPRSQNSGFDAGSGSGRRGRGKLRAGERLGSRRDKANGSAGAGAKMDLSKLLAGIETRSGGAAVADGGGVKEMGGGAIAVRPPY